MLKGFFKLNHEHQGKSILCYITSYKGNILLVDGLSGLCNHTSLKIEMRSW